MKKKVLSALLSATLIVSMLAGCGGNDTPATGSSTPAPAQGSSAPAVESNNNTAGGGECGSCYRRLG